MILLDTSIWIDHFPKADPVVNDLSIRSQIVIHGFVIGEIAVGALREPDATIDLLDMLPRLTEVTETQWRDVVRRHGLAGSGLGFVDCHLIASLEQASDVRLWTRDKKLADVAGRLSLLADFD